MGAPLSTTMWPRPFFVVSLTAALLARCLCDVACGGHRAESCQACPQGNGATWCHGDCKWDQSGQICVSLEPNVDLYELLEVDDRAESEEIKKSYRRLSVKYHPDKNPNEAERFNSVRDAYEILSVSEKRVLYDTGGMRAVKDGEQGKLQEGESLEHEVELPLSDFYRGTTKKVHINRRVICRRCRSTADAARCRGHTCKPCPSQQRVMSFIQNGMFQQRMHSEPSTEDCTTESKEFDVVVDAGASVGDRIVFKHMSSQMPGQIPGHVTFKLKQQAVSPKSMFHDWTRAGSNLRVPLELTLRESLLSFERRLTHLDGHIVVVSHEGVTQPGKIIRIEGEGMPLIDDRSQFGNLLLQVSVRFPEAFSTSEIAELAAVQALKSSAMGEAGKDEL